MERLICKTATSHFPGFCFNQLVCLRHLRQIKKEAGKSNADTAACLWWDTITPFRIINGLFYRSIFEDSFTSKDFSHTPKRSSPSLRCYWHQDWGERYHTVIPIRHTTSEGGQRLEIKHLKTLSSLWKGEESKCMYNLVTVDGRQACPRTNTLWVLRNQPERESRWPSIFNGGTEEYVMWERGRRCSGTMMQHCQTHHTDDVGRPDREVGRLKVTHLKRPDNFSQRL